ncbi:MAG: glycoside hydrolase family 125 protein [Clostridiales bacterium]|nr:glycoside hydrolase family 125 protein [Clostridiales bacterium]
MKINEQILLEYPKLHAKTLAFAERITDATLKEMFVKCSLNTLTTTVQTTADDVYLITGDIDAMWLRDSSAQVLQYLELAPETEEVQNLVKGLLRRQFRCILSDPYANAFNFEANGNGHNEDECGKRNKLVFERKFELDSLCYPLFLAARYYRYTQDKTVFGGHFARAAEKILHIFETEQYHHEKSDYYHYRPTETPELSIPCKGKGGPCGYTGMVWSGYRPSDDPCTYGYFIPGNAFITVVMRELKEIAVMLGKDQIALRADRLRLEVESGIAKYGIVNHPKYGKIYAFETDGLGNHNLMDDANIPSLLGLPYIGFCDETDEIYCNTRRFALSTDNPYFFRGSVITGIGSPHTPGSYVWPISLMTEALTTNDSRRINEIVQTLMDTTDGTGYMHECINTDDASKYSRPWFAWANSLFAYLLIKRADAITSIKKD